MFYLKNALQCLPEFYLIKQNLLKIHYFPITMLETRRNIHENGMGIVLENFTI